MASVKAQESSALTLAIPPGSSRSTLNLTVLEDELRVAISQVTLACTVRQKNQMCITRR
jgi:hypothetical protein